MIKQLICPVSNEFVNERITRVNALITILLVLAAFLFNSAIFVIFLTADFYIRAFTSSKYSPVSFVSHRIANALNLETKKTDKAPKIFAARLGFVMSLAISVLMISGLGAAAVTVGGILVFFATLELALAFCMGCFMYTYLIFPFFK
jgi:hypothetical protein